MIEDMQRLRLRGPRHAQQPGKRRRVCYQEQNLVGVLDCPTALHSQLSREANPCPNDGKLSPLPRCAGHGVGGGFDGPMIQKMMMWKGGKPILLVIFSSSLVRNSRSCLGSKLRMACLASSDSPAASTA